MRSVAVTNLKGGSGKTTTALCLAAGLADRGCRVLLVDCDPQANATMTLLNGEPAEPPTLGHVLLGRASASEAIRPTRLDGLDILPADHQLADAALLLADQFGRERRLRTALHGLDGYGRIVLDCPPELGLLTVNALNAVDGLVVPVDAGLYSIAGLARLHDVVEEVRRHLDNATLRIAGLVLTRTHRNRATADLERQLRAAYGPLVYRATVPHSVRVEEAHARNLTLVEFAPRSTPALAYDRLLSEVFGDVDQARSPAAVFEPDPSDDAEAA
jgi:chromosome partitioning protein